MSSDELVHRRTHRASRELLFKCMTSPEHLTHFWGPAGTVTPLDGITVDLRPGGAFETLMVNEDDGHQYLMRAVYETVEPPERLSWREVNSGMLTTVTFVNRGGGLTEVITHQQRVPDAYMTPEAREGWTTSLDRFAAYVDTLT